MIQNWVNMVSVCLTITVIISSIVISVLWGAPRKPDVDIPAVRYKKRSIGHIFVEWLPVANELLYQCGANVTTGLPLLKNIIYTLPVSILISHLIIWCGEQEIFRWPTFE